MICEPGLIRGMRAMSVMRVLCVLRVKDVMRAMRVKRVCAYCATGARSRAGARARAFQKCPSGVPRADFVSLGVPQNFEVSLGVPQFFRSVPHSEGHIGFHGVPRLFLVSLKTLSVPYVSFKYFKCLSSLGTLLISYCSSVFPKYQCPFTGVTLNIAQCHVEDVGVPRYPQISK